MEPQMICAPGAMKGSTLFMVTQELMISWKIEYQSLRLRGFLVQQEDRAMPPDIFTLLGNANGAPCVFPFKFNSKWYSECTDAGRTDGWLWCCTTTDFDADQLYGFCPLKCKDTIRFWKIDPSTGFHYQINSQSALTWHQARTSCQQQNAELLSITQMHEQMYLRGLTESMGSALWTGLNRLDLKSGWQWIGGSPFRYLNWAPGSPSPESGKICAALNPGRNAKWENWECDQKLGYICKRGTTSLDSFTVPSECFKIFGSSESETLMWHVAQMACINLGGNLASIPNKEVQDGSGVSYKNWANGAPTYRRTYSYFYYDGGNDDDDYQEVTLKDFGLQILRQVSTTR
ncbi:unnamed protein product [Eretmochelys imbricata]